MYLSKYLTGCCALLIAYSAQSQALSGFDCFSVLVGKDATYDGSVMLAHNEDDWGDRIVNWYKVSEEDHKKNEKITFKNGGHMALPRQTWSYLWLEMPEMEFSDTYMNEWGVTIASDACQSREDKPELTDGGIGYWLRRTMAEQATSARQAVKIGGRLVDKYGYTSSGRTYSIADPNEAWMLAVVKGKHWVAQRIPDNEVAIIPNYYTISTVDLSDTMNFYGSPDLVSYAAQKGWFDPETDSVFSFRRAYSDTGTLNNMGNIVRHWSVMNLLSDKKYKIEDEFPFSFEPPDSIKLQDLFKVLRNHNEGTRYDGSKQYTKGNPHDFGRAICSKTTQYGFVAQLRDDLPKELAFVMWLAPFRPCVQTFTPLYFGISEFPENYNTGNYKMALASHFEPIDDLKDYAPDHAFLDYVAFAKDVDSTYKERIETIRNEAEMMENAVISKQPVIEERILKLYNEDHEKGIRAITGYSIKQLKQVKK